MNKKIKHLLFSFFLLLIPMFASAASGSISLTGSSSAVVGNTVTINVTISSSTTLGSWQADLNYDRNYLKLTSTNSESGGTAMAGNSTNGSTKSKTYKFTFRALKSGSTKVSIDSYIAYDWDTNELSMKGSTRNIKIMTQEELESTYSDDADLKSLSVDGYELTPEFNKDTQEYSLEVENDITSIKINATKSNSNASIDGLGDKTLEEGNNKFEIIVTAQRGNTKTYVINVNRKELNPITVNINDKEYTFIRKDSQLPTNYETFTNTTVTYQDTEIPALHSDALNITIVGLKDSDGNIYTYVYDDDTDTIKNEYYEISSDNLELLPLELPDNDLYKIYKKGNTTFKDRTITSYNISDNLSIIYAKNVLTNEDNYYLLNNLSNNIILYNGDIDNIYKNNIKKYMYIIYLLIILVILFFILFISKNSSHKKDKSNKIEDNKNNNVEEIKIDKKKNKKNKNKDVEDKNNTDNNHKEKDEVKEDTIDVSSYLDDDFIDDEK